ncbi:hypothetical protein PV327_004792 [Microctonus hyperodae]|uniref:Uncharacterized protein n=1 Tax=Microctonus hyperodae TaxID=165561 RepID=A0AA39FD69_MICHY|nr:hypothetical protein PV327_004792 [Microctonus hyperodae]
MMILVLDRYRAEGTSPTCSRTWFIFNHTESRKWTGSIGGCIQLCWVGVAAAAAVVTAASAVGLGRVQLPQAGRDARVAKEVEEVG